MEISEKRLFDLASKAMDHAYAPYSNYAVGAAIICEDGQIYTGVNVENASYGLTNCAERTAIFKAVSEGATKVRAILVVNNTAEMSKPCGACRQVMSEFMEPDNIVFLANKDNEFKEYSFKQILPLAFSDEDMD
ncbi:cytidine deaminase [Companilactobacillus alimentarius]|uniref:Cytidine deaminase n=1 Tax=Companilactobacillus alimentarius DSM 20249 TaxID=1423720 RepID=A0A2K9HHT9_9LACO|nr:cytidine deaminase [Companilactobacillus alimentarius DSM 20249]KRK75404.1 cytidine deaminase [Companilactobacillus alimentarius DSM 20249]GEO43812.1 cytidine deaminase [Companilactobacillus alimentarius]